MSEIGIGLNNWNPMAGRIYTSGVGANAFVTASTVALLATPTPKYDENAIAGARVIGLLQDWNISQTKQAPQLFECGSNGKYTLSTGRIAGSASMSRVIYHGSNLLYLLYAGAAGNAQISYGTDDITDIAGYKDDPAEGNPDSIGFAINLASSVFLNPLGLLFVIRTAMKNSSGDNQVASFFLEDAYINNHGIGASAGAPYVGEQVSLTFEGVYPIESKITAQQPWPRSDQPSMADGVEPPSDSA